MSESAGAPFHWEKQIKKLALPKNVSDIRKKFNRKLAFAAIILLVIFCQGLYPHPETEITLFDKTLCNTIVAAFGFSWCFVSVLRTKTSEIITYINGLLSLSNEIPKTGPKLVCKIYQKWFWTDLLFQFSKSTFLDQLAILYAYSLTFVCIASPFLVLYGILWNQPCKPALAAFWMLPECHTMLNNNWLLYMLNVLFKLLVFLCNQYGLLFIIKNLPFVATNINVFCLLAMTKLLHIFKSRCLFWNGTSYMSLHSPLLLYRKLQILNAFMNDIMKWGIVSPYIACATLLLAVSSTVLIRISWSSKNMVLIILYGYIFVMEMLTISVLFTLLSKLYTVSEMVVQELSKKRGVIFPRSREQNGNYFLKRVYWSLSNIKVRFGSLNFVDSYTPLNLVHFANEVTVQTLLLT